MTPILYDSNEIGFTTNGLCRLRDCITCVVTEERNGIYECDFTYPVTGANFEQIECGRIIGVKHDDTSDIQPFDIISYSKPINGVVSFHAVHISYRLRGYVTYGTNINSLSDALTALSSATPSNNFTYSADFTSSGYAGSFNGVPRSVRQFLGGVEGSILDTYGGEYEWNKFNVILHRHRGDTVDFKIRYGLNMLDYNDDVDYSETYTTAIPFWAGDDGQTIVRGNKVDAGFVPYNGQEKCASLDLTEKFETAPTSAQLEAYALNMLISNKVNLPKQSIKVDFVRLNDFEEFKDLAPLLQCKLCDSIEVIFPDYSMSGIFKIVKTEYNVLDERFVSMELGALSTTLSQALGIGEASSSTGGGGGPIVYYGECSTAAGTAAKEVTLSPAIPSLVTGLVIYVKFTNANSIANPTLNANGKGAVSIKRYGTTAPSTSAASSWNAGSVVTLLYDGSYWQMIGFNNTTYSGMTDAEYQAGTSTTNRLITPARLKSAILYHATPSNIGAVAKTGDTMTGQLITSFKSSVAPGSYGSAQSTVENLVNEVRYSSGCMGSCQLTTAYTSGSVTIATGWYNYIYTPHRTGGMNGGASGDNADYGNLFLLGMNNTNGQFLIRVSTGNIAEVMQIPTTGVQKDYVIEADSSTSNSGVWHYRKWKSGKAEAWGKWTESSTASTSDGGGYRTTGVTPSNFPTGLFSSIPHIEVSIYANGIILMPVCLTNPNSSGTDVGTWAGWRATSNTNTGTKTYCFYCISK